MPRPRFAKLDADKREAILAAATEEFSAHGYEGASYNRIIEQAGISKGAMYYYFDDKSDLYATVLEAVQVRYLAEFADLATGISTADGFWSTMADVHARALQMARAEPAVVGLIRGMAQAHAAGAGEAVLALHQRQRQFTEQLLRQGQAAGAVRTDFPLDLLVALVLSLDHAVDAWFSEHWEELSGEELERLAGRFLRLFQQMMSPPVDEETDRVPAALAFAPGSGDKGVTR